MNLFEYISEKISYVTIRTTLMVSAVYMFNMYVLNVNTNLPLVINLCLMIPFCANFFFPDDEVKSRRGIIKALTED